MYLKGDDVIKSHKTRNFFSEHATKYSVSKVVDRVDAELGHCPFLADSDL